MPLPLRLTPACLPKRGVGVANKNIIVGGAGFIGSHLMDALLEQDWDVIALDNFNTGRATHLL